MVAQSGINQTNLPSDNHSLTVRVIMPTVVEFHGVVGEI